MEVGVTAIEALAASEASGAVEAGSVNGLAVDRAGAAGNEGAVETEPASDVAADVAASGAGEAGREGRKPAFKSWAVVKGCAGRGFARVR